MAKYLYDIVRSSSEFIVIFDYIPHSGDELHVKAGHEVKRKSTIGWWEEVETHDGRIGFVPRTYLALPNTLEALPWYFPDVSRAESIELLTNQEPGTYLVRPSSIDKQFALSLRTNIPHELIVQYQICRNECNRYYIHENLQEESLTTLLSYYQNDAEGLLNLKHVLTKSCPKYAPSIFQLTPRNQPISIDEIKFISEKEIGAGNFGNVYAGYYRQFKIAIKKLKEVNGVSYFKELLPLIELNHKNVVKFYGVVKQTRWLIFEFVDYCLRSQLVSDTYTENQMLHIASQIANGMTYMHSMNYLHRDLAARNVLITINLVAKLSDFGMSRKMIASNYYEGREGGVTPYKWEALESITKYIYDKSTDVWSFGVLMYEIYSRASIPYEDVQSAYQLKRYLEAGNRLQRPDKMPEKLYKYVYTFWHVKSKKRPKFTDIHKFLLKFK